MITKRCIVCDKQFEVKNDKKGRARVTCGDKSCASKAAYQNIERVEKRCRICGSKTQVAKSAENLPVYCSDRCKKRRYKHICVVCKNEFRSGKKHTKTCSRKCTSKLNKSKLVEVTCAHCGDNFERPSFTVVKGRRHFCSKKCRDNFFGSLREPNRYGGTWERKRKVRLELDGRKCLSCGKHESDPAIRRLEVHHVKPIKEFVDPNDAHYVENLRTLCSSCHKRVEKGDIECP